MRGRTRKQHWQKCRNKKYEKNYLAKKHFGQTKQAKGCIPLISPSKSEFRVCLLSPRASKPHFIAIAEEGERECKIEGFFSSIVNEEEEEERRIDKMVDQRRGDFRLDAPHSFS